MRSTYTTPRRYHRGMAGQCPRGHDGIKPGEVADDTSVNHQLAKHRSRRGQGRAARDQARGRHGQDLELQRRRGCERPGSNRQDLSDRRNRRRLIYRLGPISAADSGGARRNRARRQQGDAVDTSERGGATGRADRATWSGSTM
jgi:hypothetical protein